MTVSATVDGAAVEVVPGKLRASLSTSGRSAARFPVVDHDGTLRFRRGDEVEIFDDDVLLWSGYVATARATRPGFDGTLMHDLRCIDQRYLADKRIAARTYEQDTTAGAVVRDLHETYLSAEGVTLGTVQDGATLSAGMIVNYRPVSDALDKLTGVSDGFVWRIDSNKVLSFHHRSATSAPWRADGGSVDAGAQLTSGNPEYRNREYVLGGLATTDTQVETRAGDGDATAFTMGYPLATKPTVSLNGVEQSVGIKGLDDESSYDWGWNKGDATLRQSRDGDVLTSTDTLKVSYKGQYPIVARVDAPGEIADTGAVEGGSGVVEFAGSEPGIDSLDEAFSAARSRLDRYAVRARELHFTCGRAGLEPGQRLTVDLPELGLSSVEMLVQDLSFRCDDVGTVSWSVTAIDGPELLPWVKVLGRSSVDRRADLLSVGSGTVLALMATFRDAAGWSEDMGYSVQACPMVPFDVPVVVC